ncbi:MAG: CoA pyrophosphatase [Dehalococcoidia bacterium]
MPTSTRGLPAQLATALAARNRFELDDDARSGLRVGAVLALLLPGDDGFDIVFTRRTEQVATHKGQVALPGGRTEPGDPTLWDTALRETFEEIGVRRDQIEYVGALDDLATNTRFALTPFVGLLRERPRYRLQASEVAEVFEVPIKHLLDPASHSIRLVEREGTIVPSPAFIFGHQVIWGVTGRIMSGFLEVVRSVA